MQDDIVLISMWAVGTYVDLLVSCSIEDQVRQLANKSYGKSKETNKPNEQTKTQTTKSPNAQHQTKHIAPSITSISCDQNQDDFKTNAHVSSYATKRQTKTERCE